MHSVYAYVHFVRFLVYWDTSVSHARLSLEEKKSHLALPIILNMIMHKQGRKTLSKELCIDCQRLLQEVEIQFENK